MPMWMVGVDPFIYTCGNHVTSVMPLSTLSDSARLYRVNLDFIVLCSFCGCILSGYIVLSSMWLRVSSVLNRVRRAHAWLVSNQPSGKYYNAGRIVGRWSIYFRFTVFFFDLDSKCCWVTVGRYSARGVFGLCRAKSASHAHSVYGRALSIWMGRRLKGVDMLIRR